MRLLIVDDHEVVRRGVRSLLSDQTGWDVCGEAIDGQDALDKARELKPDLIVMDVSMPRLNGLEATRQLRNLLPQCEVLVLSQHENSEMARQALKAGARGYVVKSSISRDLISAVGKVSRHEYFFDPAILDQTPTAHTDVQEILQRSAAFEQALRQSEQLYRSTFELAAVGVAHVSPEGQWLRVNKKLCEIVGYSEQELLSLTFQDVTHPDDLAADLAQTEKVRNGTLNKYSMEKRYIRKDRSHVWINLTVSGVRDTSGKLQHFISVVEDISARKSAERALRESEERLQLAQQVAKVGTFEWNIKTGVNRWTPELERLYGLPPGGFAGTQSAWEALVHPDDREETVRAVERALRDEDRGFEGQWRVIWSDRSVHWLLGRAWVMRDKRGEPERLIGVNVDISERKRVEDALLESQKQLVLALDSSKTAIFDWDVVQRRGMWNPQMAAIYDFHPKNEYITAEEWSSLFHPDDRSRLVHEAEQVWKEGDEFTFEFRTVRRDCEIRWVLSHGRIVRDALGNAIRMIGTHTDITKGKKVEIALQERESELRDAQRLAKVGSWHWIPTTDTVTWSEELYRIAGRDPKSPAVSYHDHHTLYTPESWSRLQEAVNEALKNGTSYSVELELVRPDGTKRCVIANGEAQRDSKGAILSLRGTVQDITERKLIEEATALLAAIVASSDDAIVSKTLDGVITTWNKSAERIFGYTANEAIGQHITLIVPPDRHAEEYDILTRLRRGERIDHFQTVRRRKDGTLIDVSVTISPVCDFSGRVIGASKVARDITVQRQAAEKVRVADEAVRLMKAQDDERRRIARDFHDSAGQTLTVLGLSVAELIQQAERVAPRLAEKGRHIEEVVQQLHREIRTTSYLLHPPLLDEAGLTSALNWYVQGLAERSGMKIDLNLSDDLGRLPADMELAIFRVVQECLTNIHRHAESKTAFIRIARENGSICVEVRDKGKGISSERLAEIQSRGSGVGIAGIRERLRQFGGEMQIESNGSGTTVFAVIPLPKEAGLPDAEPLQTAV
jgi:PAS domain S-box-containing protein